MSASSIDRAYDLGLRGERLDDDLIAAWKRGEDGVLEAFLRGCSDHYAASVEAVPLPTAGAIRAFFTRGA